MKLFIKFLVFLLPIIILIAANTYYAGKNKTINFDKSNTYFVGSSRVKRGIIPKLLNENAEKNKVHNLGINGATFLHNIILAEHLITQFEAKEIFIELSRIIPILHPVHVSLNINNHSLNSKHLNFTEYVESNEVYLFQKLSLRYFLKNIVLPNDSSSREIGYFFSDQNSCSTTNSFLKIEDLEKKTNFNHSEHLELISYLTKVAKKYNTKIHFFLPLTFNNEQERGIVTSVFQNLPDEQKVKYTEDFLMDIRNSENLYDTNHLNNKGAKIMTAYFKEVYFGD